MPGEQPVRNGASWRAGGRRIAVGSVGSKASTEPSPTALIMLIHSTCAGVTNRRRLRGEPLEPFAYRDFGSLVSLGEYSTVGNLMGFISGRSMMVEGWFAKLMYRSLYKMHLMALHGPLKVALDTIARTLTRRTEPHFKLH